MNAPDLPLQQIFVLLFMMTGPLKAVPTSGSPASPSD
jgi:hypothetical protein